MENKYKIGDKVYFINRNTVEYGYIRKLIIEDNKSVTYEIDDFWNFEVRIVLIEEDLFRTKREATTKLKGLEFYQRNIKRMNTVIKRGWFGNLKEEKF